MWNFFKAIVFSLVAIAAMSLPMQAQDTAAPDCLVPFVATAASRVTFDNLFPYRGCTTWTVTYASVGFSAVSIQIENAANASGDVAATWAVWTPASVTSGAFPLTSITRASASVIDFWPWVSVNIVSVTGTGTIKGSLYGWKTAAGSTPLPAGTSTIGTVRTTPAMTGYITDYDSGLVVAANGAAVAVTASVVFLQHLRCWNTTAGSVTVTITDTAGNNIIPPAFSVPALTVEPFIETSVGEVYTGLKLGAGAATSITCYFRGKT